MSHESGNIQIQRRANSVYHNTDFYSFSLITPSFPSNGKPRTIEKGKSNKRKEHDFSAFQHPHTGSDQHGSV